MNLPNKLTVGRIVCTIVMCVFLLLPGAVSAWICPIIFSLAALTDWFDGHIARSRGLVTNLGKFMDPLADKILNYSVMILLIPENLIPAVTLVIILFREFVVAGIRQAGAEQNIVIAANIWGKIKTFFQDISLVLILLLRAMDAPFLTPLSQILMWICAALTVISGVIYVVQNAEVLREKP